MNRKGFIALTLSLASAVTFVALNTTRAQAEPSQNPSLETAAAATSGEVKPAATQKKARSCATCARNKATCGSAGEKAEGKTCSESKCSCGAGCAAECSKTGKACGCKHEGHEHHHGEVSATKSSEAEPAAKN